MLSHQEICTEYHTHVHSSIFDQSADPFPFLRVESGDEITRLGSELGPSGHHAEVQ